MSALKLFQTYSWIYYLFKTVEFFADTLFLLGIWIFLVITIVSWMRFWVIFFRDSPILSAVPHQTNFTPNTLFLATLALVSFSVGLRALTHTNGLKPPPTLNLLVHLLIFSTYFFFSAHTISVILGTPFFAPFEIKEPSPTWPGATGELRLERVKPRISHLGCARIAVGTD